MNTTKPQGRGVKLAAVFLAILMLAALFPASVFAWSGKPGESCSSWYGDNVVGADGAAYNHPSGWQAMLYHANGTTSYVQYKGGTAYRHFTLTDKSNDTRWAYCIESGVGFETSTNGYTAGSGTNSSYMKLLPAKAQEGIMLTALYGWKPGAKLPVAGINANDYYMATQILIWEWQQQLRTSTGSRKNNGSIPADQFYNVLKGRPAESAYNWILGEIEEHSTLPSFTASTEAKAKTHELKYNPNKKLYSLTLTDTKNLKIDLEVLKGSGITVTRSGAKYTFTSSKMIESPVTYKFRKDVPTGGQMLVWGRAGYQTMMTGADDPVEFYAKFKTETYGTAKLVKTSEDGIVAGIPFTITGYGDTYNVVTGANGQIEQKLLPGTYTVTEHPIDRYVTPKAQTVTIESGKTSTVSFSNILKKFRVVVAKTDAATGYPQGDASLAGAVYGIYKGGTLVDKYTTDANGQFTTKYYVCGTDWTTREIAPSEGYQLDPAVHPVGADPKLYTVELNTTQNAVHEVVIPGRIRLIKHTDDWDPEIPEDERDESGNTGMIEKPEEGAVFEIFLQRAGSYANAREAERDILRTDADGMALSQWLPYGRYTVHQIEGEEGKAFAPDFTVFISQKEKTYSYILNNSTIMGRVRIEKHDAETGSIIPLSGTGFKVKDLTTGQFVTQKIWYPTPEELDVFYTNDEGWLMMPEQLPYGSYELHEVEAPYGYVLDGEPVPFTIDGSDAVVTVVKPNMPQKGTIALLKEGEAFASVQENDRFYLPVYEVMGLPGATYTIIADEDITTGDGTVRAEKDTVVDTITTGEDGRAASGLLYLGRYRVVETEAPAGMVLNEEIFFIELTYAGQDVEVTTAELSVYNERQKVAVELEKALETDAVFGIGYGEEYKDIAFALYADEDITALDGSVLPKGGLLEVVNVEPLGTEHTKENGKTYALYHSQFAADLPFGSYYVQEYATNNHYILGDTQYPVVFGYEGQDTALVTIAVNEGEAVENDLLRGDVEGVKVGEESEGLAGAVFGLFHPDDTEMTEETALLLATSDETGHFAFTSIPFQHWVIREIASPEGYVLSPEIHHVYIGTDGQKILIRMENRLIRGNVQLTKMDNDKPGEKLGGAVFELYEDTDGNKKWSVHDKLLGTLDQPDGGIHEKRGLLYGGYFVKEKSAPKGYHLDKNAYYFEIKEDGQTVVLENKMGVGFVNHPKKGNLEIRKTSSDGKLEGFGFVVKGPGYCETFTTDANGNIHIKGLCIGSYTVSEVDNEASAGYLLPEAVKAEVKTDATVTVEMYNERVPDAPRMEVPQTGDDNKIYGWVLLLALSLATGTAAVVVYKKKPRKPKQ